MIPFVLVAALIGAVIGRRFTVAALILAVVLTCVIAVATRITGSAGFGQSVMELATALICLQMGYCGGAAVRLSLGASAKAAGPFGSSHVQGSARVDG